MMKRRSFLIALVLILSTIWCAWSQASSGSFGTSAAASSVSGSAGLALSRGEDSTSSATAAAMQLSERALLAYTTSDYPVTPGDMYELVFLRGATSDSVSIVVGTDYSVNMGVFGIVSARGQSFDQFRRAIERLVASSYPGSMPQVIIKSTGVFRVQCLGEVTASGEIGAWGLTRLSSVWHASRTAYSSMRTVSVRSADGTVKSYDLFKAERDGNLKEDPYLRPGDLVTLSRHARVVNLSGHVRRPGTYQLLAGETLDDLLKQYGNGLTPEAKTDLVLLAGRVDSADPSGSVRFIDINDSPHPVLKDGDSVTVPALSEYLPVIYIEGAIAMGTEGAAKYGIDREYWRPGDTLSRVVRALAGRLSPAADLKRAFLARKGSADTIPVNLEKLLFSYDPSLDLALEPEDRIVIPFGSLDVFVTGEVTRSAWVNVQALTRLSAVVTPLFTPYSSYRDIMVRSDSGDERSYDLFQATRYGRIDEDPYLKSGDTVIVNELQRSVTIAGRVRRPGTYQLLPGEDLVSLVEAYALNFSERADTSRLVVERIVGSIAPSGQKLYISYDATADFVLVNRDTVTIGALDELLPVIWFEGALGVGDKGTALDTSARLAYSFVPGERLSTAVQKIRAQIGPVSALDEAYIRRGTERILVDLNTYLYDKDFSKDYVLEPNDVIVVPFRQMFVTVSGAVRTPGRYPYIPDRTWEYYVALAGGLDKDKNSRDAIDVLDRNGSHQNKSRIIEPEDSITAQYNSFLYNFGKVASILSTILSVTSIVITLLSLAQ